MTDWSKTAAELMYEIAIKDDDEACRSPDFKGVPHARYLLNCLIAGDYAFDTQKAHRHLAHAFCILIYEGRISSAVACNVNRIASKGFEGNLDELLPKKGEKS